MQLGRVEVHRICWFWELHCLVHCEFKKISVPCFSSNLYWSVQKGPWHLFLKSCRSWFDPRVPNQNPSWHLGTAKAYESAPFCSGNVPLECLSFLGHLDSQLGPTCDWGIWSFCIPRQGKDIMKDRLGVHWPMFFFWDAGSLWVTVFWPLFSDGFWRWAPPFRSLGAQKVWWQISFHKTALKASRNWIIGPRCRVAMVRTKDTLSGSPGGRPSKSPKFLVDDWSSNSGWLFHLARRVDFWAETHGRAASRLLISNILVPTRQPQKGSWLHLRGAEGVVNEMRFFEADVS